MELLKTILLSLHLITSILLIFFIVMQKTTGDGFLNNSQTAVPNFQTAEDVVTKIIRYLAIFFVINMLLIATINNRIKKSSSIADQIAHDSIPISTDAQKKGIVSVPILK